MAVIEPAQCAICQEMVKFYSRAFSLKSELQLILLKLNIQGHLRTIFTYIPNLLTGTL